MKNRGLAAAALAAICDIMEASWCPGGVRVDANLGGNPTPASSIQCLPGFPCPGATAARAGAGALSTALSAAVDFMSCKSIDPRPGSCRAPWEAVGRAVPRGNAEEDIMDALLAKAACRPLALLEREDVASLEAAVAISARDFLSCRRRAGKRHARCRDQIEALGRVVRLKQIEYLRCEMMGTSACDVLERAWREARGVCVPLAAMHKGPPGRQDDSMPPFGSEGGEDDVSDFCGEPALPALGFAP